MLSIKIVSQFVTHAHNLDPENMVFQFRPRLYTFFYKSIIPLNILLVVIVALEKIQYLFKTVKKINYVLSNPICKMMCTLKKINLFTQIGISLMPLWLHKIRDILVDRKQIIFVFFGINPLIYKRMESW
jgi:hypothetical protein